MGEPKEDRDYAIEIYKLYREKVTHEDNLVHQRTIWFVTLQALLFTSFAILVGDAESGMDSALKLAPVSVQRIAMVMAVVGMTSAIVTLASVSAAFLAIDKCQDDWKEVAPKLKVEVKLPGVVGIGKLSGIHSMGKIAAWAFPGLVGVAWLVVAGEVYGETLFRCS